MKYIKSIVSNSIHFKELENSVLFILDDGFKFFHPLRMTNFIGNNIEITYTDEWKFTLRKSEKVNGEWVDIETKEVKGGQLQKHLLRLRSNELIKGVNKMKEFLGSKSMY